MMNNQGKFAVIEIVILVMSIFAFGYLTRMEGMEAESGLVEFLIKMLIGFLKIKQIGVVSAGAQYCCPQTCSNVEVGYEDCTEDLIQTRCEDTAACQLGCCIDNQGVCNERSPRGKCESEDGEWVDRWDCKTAKCEKGCCILGRNVRLVEEEHCRVIARGEGYETFDWKIGNEAYCFSLAATQFEGACMFAENACTFGTEQECVRAGGAFRKDYLCSHPDLETNCEKQASVGCAEDKDEIYWFDSCGNRENIYDANRDRSWNGGNVLNKGSSCGLGAPNTGSKTCGNCDRQKGSVCSETRSAPKIQGGNFVCETLNCIDEQGNTRKNGESWCVYDGLIGKGRDVVGSRHWKRMCIEGEIKVEPCADYRAQICVEAKRGDGEASISNAACKTNLAMECIYYNYDTKSSSGEDTINLNYNRVAQKCDDNSDCYSKTMNFGRGYSITQCLPMFPPGMALKPGVEGVERNDNLCGMADFTCTKVRIKKIRGWKCVAGCNCDSQDFIQQMNDWCKSLGDCGGDVNIVGDGSHGYSGDGRVNLDQYKENAIPDPNQEPASPGTWGMLLGHISIADPNKFLLEDAELGQKVGKWVGSIGGLGFAVAWYTGVLSASQVVLPGASLIPGGIPSMGAILTVPPSPAIAAAGAGAFGAAVGVAAGMIVIKLFGAEGDAATVIMLSAILGGLVTGVAVGATAGLKAGMAWGPIGAIIVALVGAAIAEIFGWGDKEEEAYVFNCHPWQAPVEDQKCNQCNEDPLKPCTRYRCESLGQACRILNENTERVVCEQIPDDLKAPVMTPGEISEGFDFFNSEAKRVEIRTNSQTCIPEFTTVKFNLTTDEYAQCKYSFERDETYSYEDMPNYPADGNAFLIDHAFVFAMPSLDSLSVYNVTGDLKKMFGNTNMFIRCMDSNGNYNLEEYVVNFCIESGPDLTAARIEHSVPDEDSYLVYGTANKTLLMWLNEPAECKWDSVAEKDYELMQNEMTCLTELTQVEPFGWSCYDNIVGLVNDENPIHIKCKDQPWLAGTVNASKRNVNAEDFVFVFRKSPSVLKIDSILPDRDLSVGSEPTSFTLEVRTSGGVNEGQSRCYWGGDEESQGVLMRYTDSNYHTQELSNRFSGRYKIYVTCIDEAGNEAKGLADFRVTVDSEAPELSRISRSGGVLSFTTNERAECYYSLVTPNFDIDGEDSESITVGFSETHSFSCITGKVYHIKCRDAWGRTRVLGGLNCI